MLLVILIPCKFCAEGDAMRPVAPIRLIQLDAVPTFEMGQWRSAFLCRNRCLAIGNFT